MKLKAAVVGAAGFAGIELVRLLLKHPRFEVVAATSDTLAGTPVSQVYPGFRGVTNLTFAAHDEASLENCDVVFLAVPHTAALAMAPSLINCGVSVIDLSADFRLKNPATYEKWYRTPHVAQDLLSRAAFGLPEITGEELARARAELSAGIPALIACAGCYPTATSLAAAPALRAGLVDVQASLIVDALSGVTGAGKKATERTHFCFANDNVEAYGVGTHRHTPEIEQILGVPDRVVFTPHLVPLNRGLLSTVKLALAPDVAPPCEDDLVKCYSNFYAGKPFVHVLPQGVLPKTSSVVGTNYAHIGVTYHAATRTIIAVGAIDNLGKGAAGQALQCANIVFGFPEECGLEACSLPV